MSPGVTVARLVALGSVIALLSACAGDPDRAGESAPPLLASAGAATPAYGDTYIDSLLGDISSRTRWAG